MMQQKWLAGVIELDLTNASRGGGLRGMNANDWIRRAKMAAERAVVQARIDALQVCVDIHPACCRFGPCRRRRRVTPQIIIRKCILYVQHTGPNSACGGLIQY